jgi:methylenetetrahydrofolate reductase (NADPH)
VSFEFFPPKTPQMEATLWESIQLLAPLKPAFVSVTYGVGGSTRDRTHATVKRILKETSLTPAAHLTCVGATREAIDAIAGSYWESDVRHIVALRGDLPEASGGKYTPHPGGYAYASDLVAGLKRIAGFEISVAAYPETHPEAAGSGADLDNLKRKLDAGADRAITQFFFDVDVYLRFLEKTRGAGITVPIVPGILPVTNYGQMKRFAAMCGTNVPDWLARLFEGSDENPELRALLATSIAAEQCRLLRAAGIEEFHFYTLNRAKLTLAICHILGIRAPIPVRK